MVEELMKVDWWKCWVRLNGVAGKKGRKEIEILLDWHVFFW